jgi:hypothetical protein
MSDDERRPADEPKREVDGMTGANTDDVVDRSTAEVPLNELTDDPGVREAFALYEAAAAAYTTATSYYAPVVTSSTGTATAD